MIVWNYEGNSEVFKPEREEIDFKKIWKALFCSHLNKEQFKWCQLLTRKWQKYNKDKTWSKGIEWKWMDGLMMDQFLIGSETEEKAW